MPNNDNQTTVRGLDPETYKKAKMAAIEKEVTIGNLINQAVKEYLEKDQEEDHRS